MNLLPRDFEDINCSTCRSVYSSSAASEKFEFVYDFGVRFRVSIFGVWYLFVDNIAATNTIIRKYYNELFLSRDINSSVFEGVEISNEVTLSDNFISNARIYSGGYYGWSAFHVSRQLDATNKLFEQVILEPLKFYLPLKHTSIRI